MAKRLFTGLGLLAGLGLAGFCLVMWLTAPRHNITQAGYDAIAPGMTEAEVEAVLGVPAGDYVPDDTLVIRWVDSSHYPRRGEPRRKEWCTEQFAMTVYFDANGRVSRKSPSGPWVIPSENPTLWARLRGRFGL